MGPVGFLLVIHIVERHATLSNAVLTDFTACWPFRLTSQPGVKKSSKQSAFGDLDTVILTLEDFLCVHSMPLQSQGGLPPRARRHTETSIK